MVNSIIPLGFGLARQVRADDRQGCRLQLLGRTCQLRRRFQRHIKKYWRDRAGAVHGLAFEAPLARIGARCSALLHGKYGAAVKYWEIIADNLSKAGWSLGWVSAIDSSGRTMWIANAHRDDAKRFVVRTDDKLTAFLELESAIRVAADCLDKLA